MPLLDSCINSVFEPGNIGSSSGTPPTVITPGTIEDPVTYDPESVSYSLDYSKFYNSMYLLLLMFGGGDATLPSGGGGGGGGGGYDNTTEWPSVDNRPTYSSGFLYWAGPTAGGASTTTDTFQSLALIASAGITTTTNGQTIEGLDIAGRINVRHSGVTIQKCRITDPDFYSIYLDAGSPTSLTVEDCLLDGGGSIGTTGISPEVTGTGVIIRRNNITGYENGSFVASGMTFVDNWIHDLAAGGAAHTDGIQGTGGYTSLTIDHNTIESVDTSCIIQQNESAGFSGLVVNNNRLVGEVSACIYIRGDKASGGTVGACSVTNNRMHTTNLSGSYASVVSVAGPITWTGNVDDVTNASIPTY